MSLHRQFELIYLLLEKPMITAQELAEHFEVSTRTIYRDIDVLSSTGIPVYTTRGQGGGISLMEGYTLHAALLSNAERENILTGLQTLEATGLPYTKELLKKISTLFQYKKENWLSIDFSPWGSSEENRESFLQLKKAILESIVLRYLYVNNKGEQNSREVEPMQLLFKHRFWYLFAYCRLKNDFRMFKLSRIHHLQMTSDKFEPKVIPSGTEYTTHLAETILVTLHLSPKASYRVYDEFKPSDIHQEVDGSYTVSATFPIGSWLEDYLFTFSDLLLDVQPMDLKQKLHEKAAIMTRQLLDK